MSAYDRVEQAESIDPEHLDVHMRLDEYLNEFERRVQRSGEYLQDKKLQYENAEQSHAATSIILENLKQTRAIIHSPRIQEDKY